MNAFIRRWDQTLQEAKTDRPVVVNPATADYLHKLYEANRREWRKQHPQKDIRNA